MLLCPGTRCCSLPSRTVHQTRVRLYQIDKTHKLEATARRQARERFLRSTIEKRMTRRKKKGKESKWRYEANSSPGGVKEKLITSCSTRTARRLAHTSRRKSSESTVRAPFSYHPPECRRSKSSRTDFVDLGREIPNPDARSPLFFRARATFLSPPSARVGPVGIRVARDF